MKNIFAKKINGYGQKKNKILQKYYNIHWLFIEKNIRYKSKKERIEIDHEIKKK